MISALVLSTQHFSELISIMLLFTYSSDEEHTFIFTLAACLSFLSQADVTVQAHTQHSQFRCDLGSRVGHPRCPAAGGGGGSECGD